MTDTMSTDTSGMGTGDTDTGISTDTAGQVVALQAQGEVVEQELVVAALQVAQDLEIKSL